MTDKTQLDLINQPRVLFIMGPTASGKTALAISLYKKYQAKIISVDSALVYQGMDIGTAKPSKAELAEAPHELIDICDPSESYSASRFVTDARALIDEALENNQLPILVGGTMLYFNALVNGLAELPEADPAIRQGLEQVAEEFGWGHLHQRLAAIDPASAKRIEPADSQRIQRAIEVFELTGVPLSEHFKNQAKVALPYPVTSVAIAPTDKALLNQRIEQRFQQMLDAGFLDEVKALKARADLHENLPAIRSVGYRQAWQHLEGKLSYEQMIEKAIIATRQLGKRQRTWLRKWPDLVRLATNDLENCRKIEDLLIKFDK
jgi:tRNA dimethylallyltransferase